MTLSAWNWRRIRTRVLLALAAPAGLAVALTGRAGEPIGTPTRTFAVERIAPLATDLCGYRQLGLERQPALKAYRASLAAAEEKLNALEKLRLAGVIRRDLPIRRQQAAQGMVAAEAQLRKAEYDTIYAVTRTYLSAVYAREQLAIADRALDERPDAVTSLAFLRSLADKIYKDRTRRDVKKYHVEEIDLLIQVTRGRRQEALQGVERALAALREAVGLDEDCPIAVDPKDKMPNLKPAVDRGVIVALALERRGEMRQAAAGIEVTSLEIEAQKATFGLQAETFASGSDLHADPVPQGMANGEYRPGAITVEMPAKLVGKRHHRVEQVLALQARAAAVADKTRHLITLEAEDAYFRWTQASRQVEEYEKAAKTAEQVADQIADREMGGFNPNDLQGGRPTLDELVDARVRATQLRLQANQARFNALLALVALERVTAGGFDAGFCK